MTKLAQHLSTFAFISSLCLANPGGAIAAKPGDSPFFGRWTVKDEKPVYSANGKLYKTIDVAPCWKDFCGVSVSDTGACGPTLFRFLTSHATSNILTGHGKWGDVKKKVQLMHFLENETVPVLSIGLGEDGFDFESREGSMPTFEATYAVKGAVVCRADEVKLGT